MECNAQEIRQELDAIWSMRLSYQLQATKERFLGLIAAFAIDLRESAKDRILQLQEQGIAIEQAIEFLAVEIAILRGDLKIEEARSLLTESEVIIKEFGLPRNTKLEFQAGMLALAGNDFSVALLHFLACRRQQDKGKFSPFIEFNIAVCYEALGYDFESVLNGLEELEPNLINQSWAQQLVGQMRAMKLRALFRRSEFKALREAAASSHLDAQSLFYLSWLGRIPSLDIPQQNALEQKLTELILDHGPESLTAYRLRTLEGRCTQSDLSADIHAIEKVDRLYLWIWQWLLEPSRSGMERILIVWDNLKPQLQSETLTATDSLLLENALRWLGLFAVIDSSDVDSQVCSNNYAMSAQPDYLILEKRFLDGLFAGRDGKHVLLSDIFYGICKDRDHYQYSIFPTIAAILVNQPEASDQSLDPCFSWFLNSLRSIVNLGPKDADNKVYIDLREQKIFCNNPTTEIYSEQFISLISLFLEKNIVPKRFVFKHCFGISKILPDVHEKKLANLLSRVHAKFSDRFRFRVSGDSVVLETNADYELVFLGQSEHAKILYDLEVKKLFTSTAIGENFETAGVLRKSSSQSLGTWVSRAKLEAYLNISKATANRRIAKWLDDGLLLRKGAGKATRYRLTKDLHEKIEEDLHNE